VSRELRIVLRNEWKTQGLLSSDQRARTLRKVLVTYPDVRHILPDRVRLERGADAGVVETLRHFLERQHWLLTTVVVE
jgi:hypothetical protein